jgi:hypothetical protein
MNMLRVCLILALLLLLSGCVYLDIACQDTAVPLHPKKISASMHYTNGADITHTYYTDSVDEQEADAIDQAPLLGLKAVVGLSPKTDLVFNYASDRGSSGSSWVDSYSSYNYDSKHLKFGVKCLLSQNGKSFVSVQPSLYLADGQTSGKRWDNSVYLYKYDLRGIEGQLLLTHQSSKHVSATLVARAQYNIIQKTLDGRRYGPYTTMNSGIRGNVRLSVGIFHLTPEIGVEVLPIVNGETVFAPIMSLGFGLQL